MNLSVCCAFTTGLSVLYIPSIHQISTLEKTKFYQYSILSSLVPWLLFPGLTEIEDDTNDSVLAIRFIIGLDFAVTRSPPESFRDRFAIVSEHTVELKWLELNKPKR